MNMKNLIQQMTDIENSKKEQINEAASITISAETGAEISDMIASMQGNAGMQSKPVPADMPMPMRHDIEKFRGAMDDDPNIPGRDDVEGDEDLQAGLIGALAGGALGSAAGAATGATGTLAAKGAALGAKAGSGIAGAMGKGIAGKIAGGAAGSAIGGAAGAALPGAAGAAIGDKMSDDNTATEDDIEEAADPKVASMIAKFVDDMDTDMMYYGEPDVAKVSALIKQGNIEDAAGEMADAMNDQDGGSDKFDMVMQRAQEYIEDYMDNMGEGYANEPEAQYGDMSDAIPDGNDLNRKKKAYAATQDGDNPMAVENIKAALYAALSEKKAKPDFADIDDDGNEKETMKKAAKDKKKKTNEGEAKEESKMPSKAEVMKCCKEGMSKADCCKKFPDCDQTKLKEMYESCMSEMKDK